VLRSDARDLFDRLVSGPGLPAVLVSVAAGLVTLALLRRGGLEATRLTAGLTVAAVVAGWALAQQPRILPGLTLEQAAAPRSTQIAVLVAVLGGGAILFPSLALLFRLTLAGRLREGAEAPGAAVRAPGGLLRASHEGLLVRAAGALGLIGLGLVNVADADWAHVVGALAFVGCIALGVLALAPGAAGARSDPGG
jgi:cytochrome d ubiquinol oxidase subunit II